MLLHDVLNLFGSNSLAQLLHGLHNVLRRDEAGPIGIELSKHSVEALVSKDLLDRNRRCQEFCIVDPLLAMEIDFRYYLVQLMLEVFNFGLIQGLLQLLRGDVPSLLLIYLLEHSTQVLDIAGVGDHLHQDVESHLLQSGNALEPLETLKHLGIEVLLLILCVHLLILQEPGVLEGLDGCDTLLGVHYEHLADQVLAFL